jgi:hypothetical protein
VQTVSFRVDVVDEGPPGWGGRIRYQHPTGLFSMDRFSNWRIEEKDGETIFQSADGTAVWEIAFSDLRERVAPWDLEVFADAYFEEAGWLGTLGFSNPSSSLVEGFRWREEVSYPEPSGAGYRKAVFFFEQWGTVLFVHQFSAPEEQWAAIADWPDRLAASFEAYEAGLQVIPDGWIPFIHSVAGFEMLYPPQWQEQADDSGLTLTHPEVNKGLMLTGEPVIGDAPVDRRAWGKLTAMEERHGDLAVISSGPGRLGQLSGWYYEYAYWDEETSEQIREVQVTGLDFPSSWEYTLRYWAPEAIWDQEQETIQLMRLSIRLTTPDRE